MLVGATADMTVGFYLHQMNGDSEREALVKAQQELCQRAVEDRGFWTTSMSLDAF